MHTIKNRLPDAIASVVEREMKIEEAISLQIIDWA
jgi:hypothetical protein